MPCAWAFLLKTLFFSFFPVGLNNSVLQSWRYCISYFAFSWGCLCTLCGFIYLTYRDGYSVAACCHTAISFKKQFTFFIHFETFNLRILFLNAMNPQSQVKRSDASSLPAFPQRCVVECKWRWKLGSQSDPLREKYSKLLSGVFKCQTATVFSVSGVIFPCLSTDSSYSEPPDVQQQLNHYQSAALARNNSRVSPVPLSGAAGGAEQKTEAILHCEFCEFSSGYIQSIRRHYRDKHGGKKLFKCKDCSFYTGFK